MPARVNIRLRQRCRVVVLVIAGRAARADVSLAVRVIAGVVVQVLVADSGFFT